MKKTTDELNNIISKEKRLSSGLEQAEGEFIQSSLSEQLKNLLDEKNLKQADVIKASNLGESYAYQIFNGKREKPARDKILAIAFAMSLTLEETQRLLKTTGSPMLYARNKRDFIIEYGFEHKKGLQEINHLLYEYGFDILE